MTCSAKLKKKERETSGANRQLGGNTDTIVWRYVFGVCVFLDVYVC